jgi:hypothetical protein
VNNIKAAWQTTFFAIKDLRQQENNVNISNSINNKAAMIKNNQTRMLNSILNRHKDRIIVDRLIHVDQTTSELHLLVDPENVLLHSPEQYVELQKQRNHNFDNISEEWKA